MLTYILRRLLLMLPTLLAVLTISFGFIHLAPGDAVTNQLAQSPSLSKGQLEQLRRQLGIDRPVWEQYGRYLSDLVRGDLGTSMWSRKSVRGTIARTWPVSAEVAVLAVLLAALIGVPIGVLSAWFSGRPIDFVLRLVSILGISVPVFYTGTLVLIFPAVWFHYAAPLAYRNLWDDPATNLRQVGPPAVVLAFALSASLMRMTRSSTLEVLRQDYVRTARAKGLTSFAIAVRHALKNALIPVVTLFGSQIAVLLGGTVVLESIFSLPGIGMTMLNAINLRDYTLFQGIILFTATIFLVTNLLIDLSYAWLDPRIRYE